MLSQHIGDLDTAEARDAYDRARADITRLHGISPRIVVRDLHPDYHSSHAAEVSGLPAVAVQHHLAHVAACMAEHRLRAPVLGVSFDGTGYGPDGTVWGGEFLLVSETGWRRVGHLRPFRLPGGDAAVREPRRSALGVLFELFGPACFAMTDLAPVAAFTATERDVLATMLSRGVNAPITTSGGRLFDAVAALLGLRQRSSYEGQAAAELEWTAAVVGPSSEAYSADMRVAFRENGGAKTAEYARLFRPTASIPWSSTGGRPSGDSGGPARRRASGGDCGRLPQRPRQAPSPTSRSASARDGLSLPAAAFRMPF